MGWGIFFLLAFILTVLYSVKFKLMKMADSPQLKANQHKKSSIDTHPSHSQAGSYFFSENVKQKD
jgi:hypothetical protein